MWLASEIQWLFHKSNVYFILLFWAVQWLALLPHSKEVMGSIQFESV